MTKKLIAILLAGILLVPTTLLVSAAVLRGDVDGDGKISSADARLALRGSVGLEELTADFIMRADVDKNGQVESADARKILRASVNLETLVQDDHEHTVDAWTPVTLKDGSKAAYHKGVCKICGAPVFGDHSNELSVIKKNTCTQPGSAVEKCSLCGLEGDAVVIPAGHDWVEIAGTKKEPTCTENGSVEMKCAACGQTKTETLPKEHLPGVAATCTKPQTCKRCGTLLTPALGHSYKKTASVTILNGIRCDRCGVTAVPCFNDLVNILKDGSHTYTGFKVTSASASEPEITGIMDTLVKLMISTKQVTKEEIAKLLSTGIVDTTYYSALKKNVPITDFSFNVVGSDKVSELTDNDVQSVMTEYMKGIDFLASLPDSYVGEKNVKEDLTAIKNTVIGDVIKVTVTLTPERYSTLRAGGKGSVIGKIDNEVAESVEDLMISNQTFDPEELNDEEIENADLFTNAMRLESDSLTSVTVTYYFDASNNAPICACYSSSILVTFAMNLYLNDDFSASDKSTGAIKLDTDTDTYSYYFFDGYFKVN